jgi:hypothetical protein
LWALGAWAGRYAAATWEATVRTTLENIKVEAERRDVGSRRAHQRETTT